MKAIAVFFLGGLLCSQLVLGGSLPTPNTVYPIGPDPALTVGSLCKRPTAYRYPEHVAYCERNVESSLKWDIIREYNSRLGYHIDRNNRADYKIDHFYPLCAGGSNERDNLWPQHKTVYVITDSLEAEVCGKMSNGRLKQSDAILLIRKAKLNLREAAGVLSYVRSL